MVVDIKATGRMVSNTAKETFLTHPPKPGRRVFGKTGREVVGLTPKLTIRNI
jgi:hypothetical protein